MADTIWSLSDRVLRSIPAGSNVTPPPGVGVPPPSRKFEVGLLKKDPIDAGLSTIVGTVKIAGTPDTPVRRRVLLFSWSHRTVRDTVSAADGSYEFTNLKFDRYYVVSFDPTNTYRAVIADNITPI